MNTIHDLRAQVIAPLAMTLALSLALLLAFVWLFVAALHEPQPHDLPLGVVAPSAQLAQLEESLAGHAPGVFAVHRYASPSAASAAVGDDTLSGALIVQRARALIVMAGAEGDASKAVIVSALSPLAARAHLSLRVVDVRPLPPHDPQGLSAFFVVFGLVIASFAFAALLYVRGRRLLISLRLGSLGLYAILAGLGTALVVDPLVGALTGHFWQVAALAALLALAVSAGTGALGHLLSLPGIGLAALLLVLLGNSSSGGPVPYRFLPDGYRQISQYLPPGAGITAVRHAVYFGGSALTQPVLVLACWSAAGIAILLAASLLGRRASAGTDTRRSVEAAPVA